MPEHVDNQLDAGAAGVADRLERLVAGLRAHAVGADPSLVNQVVEQLPRVRGGDDLAGWTVELDQVDGLHTEVASREVVPGPEVLTSAGVRCQGQAAPHFRGHHEVGVWVRGEEAADETL